jgi:hypothetical protein
MANQRRPDQRRRPRKPIKRRQPIEENPIAGLRPLLRPRLKLQGVAGKTVWLRRTKLVTWVTQNRRERSPRNFGHSYPQPPIESRDE